MKQPQFDPSNVRLAANPKFMDEINKVLDIEHMTLDQAYRHCQNIGQRIFDVVQGEDVS